MSLHAVEERERHAPWRYVYPVALTISGTATSTTMLTDVTAGAAMASPGIDWSSNASGAVYYGGVYYIGAGDYDSDFVARVLQADAAPIEATFDNVVDMLDWLERD
jgi:hypothetical protein